VYLAEKDRWPRTWQNTLKAAKRLVARHRAPITISAIIDPPGRGEPPPHPIRIATMHPDGRVEASDWFVEAFFKGV